MVWQDFMFACGIYELTPEFEQNIIQEFIDNIIRIRHHACLALWCGNNEMEMYIIGMSGMEINLSLNTASFIFVMFLNLDFSHSLVLAQ